MNKGRVEAFTDAVVAIIMTIMVLEFKVPESYHLEDILQELPYLVAYLVSFLFIGGAWYNHHYMFTLAKRITKKIYWINNFWLLSMSLIPVATAWVGRFLDKRVPEYFYLLVIFLWSVAYLWLSEAIIQTLEEAGQPQVAAKIRQMPTYRFMSTWKFWLLYLVMLGAIYVYPLSGLLVTLVELLYMAINTNRDSDRLSA